MPQLQVPLSIWLTSTPDERDSFYVQAGFDPNLPVYDSGTDTSFVRFTQDVPAEVYPVNGETPVAVSPVIDTGTGTGPQAGDDLRDYQVFQAAVSPGVMNGISTVAPLAGGFAVLAGRALRQILGGGGGRLTAAIWNSLPGAVRTTLVQLGIGVGAMVAFNGDIPFITLPGQKSDVVPFDPTQEGVMTPGVDIQIGTASPLQQVGVVGSWVANGVTFYRLADGKLAVQNKRGRWKVWRPKKPIVLYADGASSLKTMLRADKALNKQAKKIAAMLNRRAPRRRSTPSAASTPIILGNNARVVDV